MTLQIKIVLEQFSLSRSYSIRQEPYDWTFHLVHKDEVTILNAQPRILQDQSRIKILSFYQSLLVNAASCEQNSIVKTVNITLTVSSI